MVGSRYDAEEIDSTNGNAAMAIRCLGWRKQIPALHLSRQVYSMEGERLNGMIGQSLNARMGNFKLHRIVLRLRRSEGVCNWISRNMIGREGGRVHEL